MPPMTLRQARKLWTGYGRYVTRMSDCRRKETVVHFGCGGFLFVMHAPFIHSIYCCKCGRRDITAVQIVTARQAQDLNPY